MLRAQAWEATDRLFRTIYGLYSKHVAEQMRTLTERYSYSLTWATNQARHLIVPLVRGEDNYGEYESARALSTEALEDSLSRLPVVVVEEDGKRQALSIHDLSKQERFWSVKSAFIEHAERVLQEVPGNATLQAIVSTLGLAKLELPKGLLVSSTRLGEPLGRLLLRDREIAELHGDVDGRRLDLVWVNRGPDPIWFNPGPSLRSTPRWLRDLNVALDSSLGPRRPFSRTKLYRIRVPVNAVTVSGLPNIDAVVVESLTYLLPG